MSSPYSLTPYGWLVCLWVLISSFQYGYHISALNQIQAVLTCRHVLPSQTNDYGLPDPSFSHLKSDSSLLSLPSCIPMDDAAFSVVTSVFTLGGLGGSLLSTHIQGFGRKGSLSVAGGFMMLGTGFLAVAGSYPILLFGRALAGVGAGIGLCVGPIFLSEISPEKIRGSIGVLTQFAIVMGIMITQLIGLRLATPTQWRLVPAISCIFSIVQLAFSPVIVETPEWLKQRHKDTAAESAQQALWSPDPCPQQSDLEAPLLSEESSLAAAGSRECEESIPLSQLFSIPRLRRPLVIVCAAMISQQVSGINAVLYYSNDILSRAIPELGPYISLGITVVNVLMTFPPLVLIERMGRKQLLLTSIGGILLSLILAGIGLNAGAVTLSSIAITTFVMSFAIGLGPVPFVIIPEVSPPEAVSALSSTALSVNWIANFLVGLTFLPLRNLLSGGQPNREGRVFFVFAGTLGLSSFALLRAYRG